MHLLSMAVVNGINYNQSKGSCCIVPCKQNLTNKNNGLLIFFILFDVIKPLGMQASIFGACPSQDKLAGLCQEGHLA